MTGWLIDKSAYNRLATSADPEQWITRIERGLVHITTATRLEMGYSARSAETLEREVSQPPLVWLPVTYLTPATEDRAMAVQAVLAERGYHRAVSVPDLLIAAAGELNNQTVLHLDKDFELIAEVTGQPVERLALT